MSKTTTTDGPAAESLPPAPLPLRWLRAHGLRFLTPWHFIDDVDEAAAMRREFRKEVSGGSQPERDMWPFARRQGQDDVVVTGKVISAHLTWVGGSERSGYPMTERYDDIWTWLKTAIDDTASWCCEEDMPEDETEPSS
jgi:hypothetical protein